MSAYLLYSIEKFNELQKSNPDKKVIEITKIVASNWKSLKDEEKQPFHLLAEQDKKR
jgi:hypothetical protein